MANTKISALTDLAATPATNDRIPIVDVSDTTMGASGTTKYFTANRIVKTNAAGGLVADLNLNSNSITNGANVTTAIVTITSELTNGSGWQNLSFNTGWGNYGGIYQTGQYKKVGDLVFLRGLVKRSSGSATVIATLPSGYRPPAFCHAVTTSNNAFAEVDINTAGQLDLAAGNATAWVSLNGIWFSTL